MSRVITTMAIGGTAKKSTGSFFPVNTWSGPYVARQPGKLYVVDLYASGLVFAGAGWFSVELDRSYGIEYYTIKDHNHFGWKARVADVE